VLETAEFWHVCVSSYTYMLVQNIKEEHKFCVTIEMSKTRELIAIGEYSEREYCCCAIE